MMVGGTIAVVSSNNTTAVQRSDADLIAFPFDLRSPLRQRTSWRSTSPTARSR